MIPLLTPAIASLVPFILYSFPGVSGGIELNKEGVFDIVKVSPNVADVKLNCASIGKIARVSATANNRRILGEVSKEIDS